MIWYVKQLLGCAKPALQGCQIFLRGCGCTPSFEASMAITSETRAKVLWNSANSALEQAWTVKMMWNKDCLKKAWSCIIFSPANTWTFDWTLSVSLQTNNQEYLVPYLGNVVGKCSIDLNGIMQSSSAAQIISLGVSFLWSRRFFQRTLRLLNLSGVLQWSLKSELSWWKASGPQWCREGMLCHLPTG